MEATKHDIRYLKTKTGAHGTYFEFLRTGGILYENI